MIWYKYVQFAGLLETPSVPIQSPPDVVHYKILLYGKPAIGKTSTIAKLSGQGLYWIVYHIASCDTYIVYRSIVCDIKAAPSLGLGQVSFRVIFEKFRQASLIVFHHSPPSPCEWTPKTELLHIILILEIPLAHVETPGIQTTVVHWPVKVSQFLGF